MTTNLYRLKYIENDEIRLGSFARLSLILHRLDQLLEDGMYCIVIDERGNEYKAPPMPSTKPKTPAPAAIAKPLTIDAIAAYLKKPENVERRRQAKLEDETKWARLRNS
jgi:hypothetical protein